MWKKWKPRWEIAVKGARLFNRLKSYEEAGKILVKWLKYFSAPFQMEIAYLEHL